MTNTLSINDWLSQKVIFTNIELQESIDAVTSSTKNAGFELSKSDIQEKSASLTMIGDFTNGGVLFYSIVLIQSFIKKSRSLPFVCRIQLQANIEQKGDDTHIALTATPLSEYTEEAETSVLTQSIEEKAIDEYWGINKVSEVFSQIYTLLDQELDDQVKPFNNQHIGIILLVSLLIYPLEGYKSSKTIHIPTEDGPSWSFPALVIPEIWFMWNEMWGVSAAIFSIECFIISFVGVKISGLLAILLLLPLRIATGFYGNFIYHLKHGRWPE